MFKKSSKLHLSCPTSYRGDVHLLNTNQKQMHGFSPVYELMRVNFILGLNVIFLCFKLIITHCHTQRQRKTKSFQPRIKLNHNCDICKREIGLFCVQVRITWKSWVMHGHISSIRSGDSIRHKGHRLETYGVPLKLSFPLVLFPLLA